MATTAADTPPSILAPQSSLLAFLALVRLTLRRHWRVRALGWVSAGLVALMSVAVAVFTHGPVGWRLENRPNMVADHKSAGAVRMTYREYADDRLAYYQALPGPPDQLAVRAIAFAGPRAVMNDPVLLDDYAFLNFSRWVVFGLFLSFTLPLFTLAYASGAIGAEREGRTLIWLATRPLPRGAVYLAKFLGVLPWCVAVSMLGLGALCLAGGELGRRAFGFYWPAAVVASVGFSALFHLIGAAFRRPTVVGLVYVFFFETLVANLPGSLKQLSLNFYARSLLYNKAAEAAGGVTPTNLDVYAPTDSGTAVAVLLLAACALTAVGMAVFARQEPREEV